MKRDNHDALDCQPRPYVFVQIIWMICGTGILMLGLPLIASGLHGESYELPLGIAYAVIGVVVTVGRLFVLCGAVRRLPSKIPSGPEPTETERC